MDYKILYHDTANELSDDVNEMISEGWKPQGGVSVTLVEKENKTWSIKQKELYAQAMVKESK